LPRQAPVFALRIPGQAGDVAARWPVLPEFVLGETELMSEFRAPVRDMLFAINELADMSEVAALPAYEEATPDMVEAMLEGAAQLANDVVAPTNVIGDTVGAKLVDGQVVVPDEFKSAYQQYVEGGWSALSFDPEYDGMGQPMLVGMAVEEMLQSANLAWSLCPMLTQGGIHAIESYGSKELCSAYLPKMISGEWTGTMNLTEPQAGSDLSVIRSYAERDGDSFRITGQKIFITWGDHDMTDNIIHLVLARIKGAPEGVKGLSLFLVPKFKLDADGNPADFNDVETVSIEHKLGIHGSPTCVLGFQASEGYLVGEENKGLISMFAMMNRARLNVGLEGVSISERAYQQALFHANDRIQGGVAIIQHPDVRRMLMRMKSEIEAMRAVAYYAASHLDKAEKSEDAEVKQHSAAMVELLTPIVKGWSTETSQELTSVGIQVHGGAGYVEETGAAQHFRDARITTIYEGTTGIQALDLAGRKILRDGGAAMTAFIEEMSAVIPQLESNAELAVSAISFKEALAGLRGSVTWLLENAGHDRDTAGAVSYHLLMQAGIVVGGWQMARAAVIASERLASGTTDTDFMQAKVLTAKFYAEQSLPRAAAHAATIRSGGATMMALSTEQFAAAQQ
jgi:alkylation response protein AidB-like acyl-CoA dehydrogenase